MQPFHSSIHCNLVGIATALALTVIAPQAACAGTPIGVTAYGTNALSSNQANNNPYPGTNDSAFGYGALAFNTTGDGNTAGGFGALYNLKDGYSGNVAVGWYALASNDSDNNTAIGLQALYTNTTGENNTANGVYALYGNADGSYNTASGFAALSGNVSGSNNTAIGFTALDTSLGDSNTAIGAQAMYNNLNGNQNTASGVNALYANIDGYLNTANGVNTLFSNTYGYYNTASGLQALYNNVDGNQNTADGTYALLSNVHASANTASGFAALYRSTGTNNIGIGDHAGESIGSGNNNINIGSGSSSGDDGMIRIGTSGQSKTFIAGISGKAATNGMQVFINSSGQLGTLTSSARFKEDIHSIDTVSDKLLQLRPVSFRYKQAAEDGDTPLQYGLIAEEVAKVYPELVQYDQEGKPFTVYYHFLTPLLLSELQKVHGLTQARQEKIDAQQTELASLDQQRTAQRVKMLALLQQQQQEDAAEVAVLQQKVTQLDTLLQASTRNAATAEKVALVASH